MSLAGVAQLAEQLICNQQVAGSSPITSSIDNFILFRGWVPERPKGADCKSAVTDFGGSNPPPSTTFRGNGGIGRRARFRSVCWQQHAGSSPVSRTKIVSTGIEKSSCGNDFFVLIQKSPILSVTCGLIICLYSIILQSGILPNRDYFSKLSTP